jgi:hypothetical protein
MNRLKAFIVWLGRIGHCRGFGIQSPADYWLVRYVINEHWPYYSYSELGQDDNWLTQKLGRLYFRLANWCQPAMIMSDAYQAYMQAGCRKAKFGESTEMIRLTLEGDYRNRLMDIYNKVNDATLLIVEHLWKDKQFWQEIIVDERTRVTFDLYYCGIVLFDKKRTKINYIINF